MIGKAGTEILKDLAVTGHAVVLTFKPREWKALQELIAFGIVFIDSEGENFVVVKFGRKGMGA